jgi:tripeptide aminopeptidase
MGRKKEYNMTTKAFEQLLTDLWAMTERKVADFILKYCKANGIRTREDKSAIKTGGNAGNIIAWSKGVNPDKTSTMFASHMDTVDVGSSRKLKIAKGRIASASEWPIGLDYRLGVALMSLLEHGLSVRLTTGRDRNVWSRSR